MRNSSSIQLTLAGLGSVGWAEVKDMSELAGSAFRLRLERRWTCSGSGMDVELLEMP